MVRLVVSDGCNIVRFNPQRQYFDIYDYFKDQLGWEHEAADEVASWAEMAAAGASYVTDDPDLEIYIESI